MKNKKTLLLAQGIYFSLTALWPIIDIDSFMQVTGYKVDQWLVKTFSLLLLCITLCFFYAAVKNEVPGIMVLLSFTSAFALMAADIYYSLTRTISYVYLADAGAELVFIGWWLYVWGVGKKQG